MAVRITRYRTQETGSFERKGRTRAHIKIPASAGFVDLERSSLVMRMRAKPPNNQGSIEVGDIELRPWNLDVEPSMLFTRTSERSSKIGILSEKIYHNIVDGTLSGYVKSRQEDEAARNLGMRQGYYNEHGQYSQQSEGDPDDPDDPWTNEIGDPLPKNLINTTVTPFFQCSLPEAVGTTQTLNSLALTPEIHIPLQHISALANSSNARNQIPLVVLGDLEYELELDNRIRCTEYLDTGAAYDCVDATADGTGLLESVELAEEYTLDYDLRKLTIGVGTLVRVTWTGGSGGAGNAEGVVSEISVSTTGDVTYQLNIAGFANDQTLTGVQLDYAPLPGTAVPPEYEITDMFLQVHRLQLTPQQIELATRAMQNLVINYQDYFVKPEQMTLTPVYQQSQLVPKGSRGVAVLTPQNILNEGQSQRLYSGWDNAELYQFQVTNEQGVLYPTTKQRVQVGSSTGRFVGTSTDVDIWCNRGLHNVRLKEYFANLQLPMKRYEEYGNTRNLATVLNKEFNRGFYPQMLVPANELKGMTFIVETNGTKNMQGKTVLFVFTRDRIIAVSQGRPTLVQ